MDIRYLRKGQMKEKQGEDSVKREVTSDHHVRLSHFKQKKMNIEK